MESFGNTVGLLGDFATGATLARDGVTLLHDFLDYGIEWQVQPSDDIHFHEASYPQFPELCVMPEDPRGERHRRLEEKSNSEEDAEAACSGFADTLDHKDCIYDILGTQDFDMVGALEIFL